MCRASKSCFGNKSLETTTAREVQNDGHKTRGHKKLYKEDMYVCPLNRDIYIYIYIYLAMLNDFMEEENFFSVKSLLFQNCQDFDAI